MISYNYILTIILLEVSCEFFRTPFHFSDYNLCRFLPSLMLLANISVLLDDIYLTVTARHLTSFACSLVLSFPPLLCCLPGHHRSCQFCLLNAFKSVISISSASLSVQALTISCVPLSYFHVSSRPPSVLP